MKVSFSLVVFLTIFLHLTTSSISTRHIHHPRSHSHHNKRQHLAIDRGERVMKPDYYGVEKIRGNDKMVRVASRGGGAETLQIAGSRLPDCSHACGSCSPCRLVMVSFVCSTIEEAETCPMAYKCMCHSKSYPVP